MGELFRLLNLLDGLKSKPSLRINWDWFISSKGRFLTRSLSMELVNFRTFPFLHKGIWIMGIPSKISFFMWNTFLNKILTLINLQRKGWNLVNRCIMCLKKEESVYHLFIHCAIASKVRGFFLSPLHCFVLPFPFLRVDFRLVGFMIWSG